jgi:hypothetical protein
MMKLHRYAALSNLNFIIGGTTFSLTPNAQIWPRSLNTDIGGSSSSIYLIVADIGSSSGEGLDFIDGYTFLCVFLFISSLFFACNAKVSCSLCCI